jgi:hypothetical protein
MNNVLEMTWKEAVVSYFKVLSRHLPRGTKENHENFSQGSRSLGQDLNPSTKQECKPLCRNVL